MAGSIVVQKSYNFALHIVDLYRLLVEDKKKYVLSKQILRSGTSVGANREEAEGAQSKKDFLAKMSIAYKEARETHYWLRLLRDLDFITKKEAQSILQDCAELKRILTSIRMTTQKNLSLILHL